MLAKDGNLVKGRQAANDRVIGTVDSALRVQTARNVDEVTLIDVAAQPRRKLSEYVARASTFLRVPFTAGGGITRSQEIGDLLDKGADKVLLGRKAFSESGLIQSASMQFGAQAISACIEFEGTEGDWRATNLPPDVNLDVGSFAQLLEHQGVGEIILFCKSLDGLRSGVALDQVETVTKLVSVPVCYLGGVGDPSDAVRLAEAGVSGVIIGALFAFSRYTPNDVKRSLADSGFEVRL